jgi:hypothetical protein
MSKKPEAAPDAPDTQPAQATPPAKAPRVLGGAKNNIWRCGVVDKDGAPVHTAPGMTTLTFRGPGTRRDAIEAVRLLLDSKRADAINAGEDDPGYKMAEGSLEALGHSDDDLGFFRPAASEPLNLPTDPAVRAAHDKIIADKLGATDNA